MSSVSRSPRPSVPAHPRSGSGSSNTIRFRWCRARWRPEGSSVFPSGSPRAWRAGSNKLTRSLLIHKFHAAACGPHVAQGLPHGGPPQAAVRVIGQLPAHVVRTLGGMHELDVAQICSAPGPRECAVIEQAASGAAWPVLYKTLHKVQSFVWRRDEEGCISELSQDVAAPKERRFSNRRRAAASMGAWKSAPP